MVLTPRTAPSRALGALCSLLPLALADAEALLAGLELETG